MKLKELFSNIPFYIFALSLVLAAVVFLLFMDRFRTYNSEISIIFIPQNEKIAEQTNEIAENLTIIPTKLTFYEKLLSDNRDIEDKFIGYNNDRRKNLWNDVIKIKREKDSTIINISAADRHQSQKLAKQTAFTLFNIMSRYYNIRTDVDFRIIDGPITESNIKNWPILALISLVTGLILSFLINVVSSNLADLFGKRNENKAYEQKIFLSYPKKVSTEREYFEEPAVKTPEIIPKTAKKAQAPSNLPIAKDELGEPDASIEKIYPLEDSTIEKMKDTYGKKDEMVIKMEPTEEALKKRLNQLLRGDL